MATASEQTAVSLEPEYGPDSIEHFKGLEGVKKRPGMYIGDTNDGTGLHNMVKEVVDNAIDEAGAGYCDHISVTLHDDGSVTVEDNGRGIPTGIKEDADGVSAATLVMTQLHAGGKFGSDAYKMSGGTHGVGVSVVNALSDDLIMIIRRDGKVHQQKFQAGDPVAVLKEVGDTDATGTSIRFKPSQSIFRDIEFDYLKLHGRLREQAFLTKGLHFFIADRREGRTIEDELCYERGIVDFVEYLNRRNKPLHEKMIHIQGEYESQNQEEYQKIKVEVAMQWVLNSYNESIRCYTNNIYQVDGGTHAEGFRGAVTRTVNKYIGEQGFNKSSKAKIEGRDIREGMTAVISVKVQDPTFSSQTKDKLTSSEVKTAVETVVNLRLKEFLEENPSEAKGIADRAVRAAEAREEAAKIRNLKRKGGDFNSSGLPGKLADCQEKDASKRELFLVEGESAGGSAKQARDRSYQAILPLKGKILNVIKSPQRMLESDEIKALVTALGTGFANDEEFDIEKLRYHRVIIMTDADVDGSHIRTLLLAFFYNQMRTIVKHGYLYIAQPPLYKVTARRKERYLIDDSEFDEFILDNTVDSAKISFNGANELKTIEGGALKELCIKHIRAGNAMERLSRRHDRNMLEILFQVPGLNQRIFEDKAKVEALAYELSKRAAEDPVTSDYDLSVEVLAVEEGEQYAVQITRNDPGAEKVFVIDKNLVQNRGVRQFIELNSEIRNKFNNGAALISVERGSNSSSHANIVEAMDWLLADAKKGISIQRYKGLGEMNAEQLWDTTMNKETRVLRKVNLEDEFTADTIFEELMGDEVKPRREFIEQNAFSVENLDI